MARAQAHLAYARYPQAIGAFRAVVGIDPTVVPARLGLADALYALGRRDEAVSGLVEAAETLSELEAYRDALSLVGRAMALAPDRLELHVDAAMVEEAMGEHDAALGRMEGLADRYMDEGRTDEAAELLRFVATWGEDEDQQSQEEEVEAAPSELPWQQAVITGATVIARNPLLDFPEVYEPESVQVPVESDTVVRLRFESEEHDRIAEQETTVARPPSAPVPAATIEEPDADMVTQVANLRHLQPRTRTRPAAVSPRSRVAPPRPPASPPANPMVERLRARAGLANPASPQPVVFRGTEPLSVRPPMRRPSVRDEEVTMRYRRPRRVAVG